MKPSISLIIPVYNEQSRLSGCVDVLTSWKAGRGYSIHEIIFVNDGSTDGTLQKLRRVKNKISKFQHAPVRIISYRKNKGKGFAVKSGVFAASGDFILTLDVDMSTHPGEIHKFLRAIQRGADVIVGTRKNGHSTVIEHQPFLRETFGHIFTALTHAIVPSRVTDYTCGFKAFRKNAGYTIFSQLTVNRWAYDVESLSLATKYGFTIAEVPVIWTDKEGTKVELWRDAPMSLLALLQIRLNYLIGQYMTTKNMEMATINA